MLKPTKPIAKADKESPDLMAYLDITEIHEKFVQYKVPRIFFFKLFASFQVGDLTDHNKKCKFEMSNSSSLYRH